MNEELDVFVRDSLLRDLPREQIRAVLRRAGWRADQVDGALGAYAELDCPVPVPRPRPYLSARDAFMYLLLFTTLYISAFDLGHLVFQFIDRTFPDVPAGTVQQGVDSFLSDVRWTVASLIIAFPIYAFLAWRLRREIVLDPGKRASKVRKWLTYLTLFSASLSLIGDCTSLVAGVLGGGVTARFVLKIATIAVIAGAIFIYYLRDLRGEEAQPRI